MTAAPMTRSQPQRSPRRRQGAEASVCPEARNRSPWPRVRTWIQLPSPFWPDFQAADPQPAIAPDTPRRRLYELRAFDAKQTCSKRLRHHLTTARGDGVNCAPCSSATHTAASQGPESPGLAGPPGFLVGFLRRVSSWQSAKTTDFDDT